MIKVSNGYQLSTGKVILSDSHGLGIIEDNLPTGEVFTTDPTDDKLSKSERSEVALYVISLWVNWVG